MFNKRHKLKTLTVVQPDGQPIKPAKKSESKASVDNAPTRRPADQLTDLDIKRVKNLPEDVMTYLDERIGRIEAQARKTARWAAFWRTLTVIMLAIALFAALYAYWESQDIQSLVEQVKQQNEAIHRIINH